MNKKGQIQFQHNQTENQYKIHKTKSNKNCLFVSFFLSFWRDCPPSGPWPPQSRGFQITHNNAPQSVGLLWTSDQLVAETSTCTTHNSNNRQISMPPVGFEPTISAGEQPQTYALDRAATGTGTSNKNYNNKINNHGTGTSNKNYNNKINNQSP